MVVVVVVVVVLVVVVVVVVVVGGFVIVLGTVRHSHGVTAHGSGSVGGGSVGGSGSGGPVGVSGIVGGSGSPGGSVVVVVVEDEVGAGVPVSKMPIVAGTTRKPSNGVVCTVTCTVSVPSVSLSSVALRVKYDSVLSSEAFWCESHIN